MNHQPKQECYQCGRVLSQAVMISTTEADLWGLPQQVWTCFECYATLPPEAKQETPEQEPDDHCTIAEGELAALRLSFGTRTPKPLKPAQQDNLFDPNPQRRITFDSNSVTADDATDSEVTAK